MKQGVKITMATLSFLAGYVASDLSDGLGFVVGSAHADFVGLSDQDLARDRDLNALSYGWLTEIATSMPNTSIAEKELTWQT